MPRLLFLLSAVLSSVCLAAGSIHSSIDRGDLDGVKKALDEGEDINVKSNQHQTPIMHAVLSGQDAIVEFLLTKKPDLTLTDAKQQSDPQGYTPIHGAAFKGRAAIAKMLVDAGEDPSKLHQDGYSALHRTCWGDTADHTATLKVFLDAGSPAMQAAQDGGNPLKMAKESKNAGMVALLEKYLAKEGYTEKDTEKMTNARVISQQEQAATMQKMMSDPNFMDTIQKLSASFGGDTGKLQDALKGVAGDVDPNDPDAMKTMLKKLADGAGGSKHTEL